MGDVRGHVDDLAGEELEPGLLAERDHVVHRADHPQLPVAARSGGAEGAAAGVPVQQPLLNEHVEGLPDCRTADLVERTELMLGGDTLALALQRPAERVRDLQVARNAGTVVHRDWPLAVKMSRHLHDRPVVVKRRPARRAWRGVEEMSTSGPSHETAVRRGTARGCRATRGAWGPERAPTSINTCRTRGRSCGRD